MDSLEVIQEINQYLKILLDSELTSELAFVEDLLNKITSGSSVNKYEQGNLTISNNIADIGQNTIKGTSGTTTHRTLKQENSYEIMSDTSLDDYKQQDENIDEDMKFKSECFETKNYLDKNIGTNVCTYCSFKTGSPKLYKSHIESVHLVCDICEKKYNNKNDLKNHQEGHINIEGIYLCIEDGCLFKNILRLALQKHIQIVHNNNLEECEECLCKVKDMKKHKTFAHGALPVYQCRSCPLTLKSVVALKKHEQSHIIGLLDCDQCTHKADTKPNLRRHKNVIHNVGKFFCNSCPFKCSNIQLLEKHEYNHNSLTVNCKRCDKVVPREEHDQHKRTCYKQPRLFCSECTFKTRSQSIISSMCLQQRCIGSKVPANC